MFEIPRAYQRLKSLFATSIRQMLLPIVLLGGLLLGITQLLKPVAANRDSLEKLTGRQAIKQLKQDGSFQSVREAINGDYSPKSSLQQAILVANSSAVDNGFGTSAAIDRIVLHHLIPFSFTQQIQVNANDGEGSDIFGAAVAISGDTAVIGAPGDSVTSNLQQGSAYIFVRNGTGWIQQAKLAASDGTFNAGFGGAVAISGDTVVIGASNADVGSHIHQGAAYVFTRTGTAWSQQVKLSSSDGVSSDNFGYTVAISGNTVLIGAFSHDVGPFADQGAAYVFTRTGTTWSEQAEISATGSKAFGTAVALENGTAAITGRAQNALQRAVYIYVGSDASWSQQAQLTSDDLAIGSGFGTALAVSGNTVLITAPRDSITVLNQGSAYVYVRSGTSWSRQALLLASDTKREDNFGVSAALEGDFAIVGAGKSINSNINQGAGYVFLRSGTTWSQQGKLTASDGALGDQFGASVAIGNGLVLSGAPFHKVGQNVWQGAAYSFSNFVSCSPVTIAPGALPSGVFQELYDQTLSGVGGTQPYAFQLADGSLPAGLTLSSAGRLSGTPSLRGTFNFTVVATDSEGCAGTQNYTLVINPACPSITMNPLLLPATITGSPYSQTLIVSGGSGTPTFSLISGFLPLGLSLSSGGTLSGIPNESGTFNLTIRAVYADDCAIQRNYVLTVSYVCPAVSTAQTTVPVGRTGVPYSYALIPTGGTFPYVFTVSSGLLPPGITLSSNGLLSGTTTTAGDFPFVVSVTDANGCQGTRNLTLTIIAFGNLQFYPLSSPVRLLDTRPGASPSACSQPNAFIQGGTVRTQPARNFCTIPTTAQAITGNITTVESGGGFLTLYPSDVARPLVANSNFAANQILNNVFTAGLGTIDGAFNIYVTTNTNVVVDITGYYAPPSGSGLYFHPLPHPVRLMDSRVGATACFAPGAQLAAGLTSTQLGTTTCDGVLIPAGALALVGNATTVNPQANGFLTLFPADASRPLVASSNFQTGINMNAPFTVGLSPSGQFNIYTAATTDLVVDVLGYFSTQLNDSNGQGLLFNPLPAPVRLLDTRAGQTGCFTPGSQMIGGTAYLQPATGACTGIPLAAKAVVGNATTVNVGTNGFLTFWPSDANQPTVATSNYRSGTVFNRHFTVGLGADGAFKRFASTTTDLVIDLSGYFAP